MKSNQIFPSLQKIHFIGVGGIGMSGLAKVLRQAGHMVSGSDLGNNQYTQELEQLGCLIYQGHSAENLTAADLVVCSSAINDKNVEYKKAIELGIKIIKRSELLRIISSHFQGISVVGSHGKTTTASMISYVLSYTQVNASFIVGGLVKNLKTHACLTESDYLVFEADESDGSFNLYSPQILVLTNLDNDHMDYYKSVDSLVDSFQSYLEKLSEETVIVYNKSNKLLSRLNFEKFKKIYSYSSKSKQASVYLDTEEPLGSGEFTLSFEKSSYVFNSQLHGIYNIENLMASFLVAQEMKIPMNFIQEAFSTFSGAGRRQDLIYSKGNVFIYDDYAHHPTEIESIISAFKDKNTCVYFQPHRYTRTQQCWNEYLTCFDNANKIFILDIYSAGEEEIDGVTGQSLVAAIKKRNPSLDINYSTSIEENFSTYSEKERNYLFLGAGSISHMIREVVDALE